MSNELRRLITLCEMAALPPDVLDAAANHMRQMAVATGGLPDNIPDFRVKFVQWSKDQIAAVFHNLSKLFERGDTLMVWREIIAPEDWEPTEERHLGIYWTWDRDVAHAYQGNSREGVAWLLSAEVTFDQIDWVSTLSQNATPAYAPEKEIRINPNSRVSFATCERI